ISSSPPHHHRPAESPKESMSKGLSIFLLVMICFAVVAILACVVTALIWFYQWITRPREILDTYHFELQPVQAPRAPPRGPPVFVQQPGGGGILGVIVDQ
ncbi:hypothetical protein MKX03_009898, partial [Papaver bracteatum]